MSEEYCDRCIQYGNDVNNPVKHWPEDCPNRQPYTEGQQAAREHPPKRRGYLIWTRAFGLNPYGIDSEDYERWNEGYEAEARRLYPETFR